MDDPRWQLKLLQWFSVHQRDLPWRKTRDPYATWVSEVMLQQTQVATVIPYWHRWMQRFPTVEALAQADEQEVLSIWQGLGYYRRCRMLLDGARFVAERGLPTCAKDWQRVAGVGRYTAAAIASIAFDEPAPLVDGNVERVFTRLTANDQQGPKLSRNAWRWAEEQVALCGAPSAWNQALMELGATICRPAKPLCAECPVSEHCAAFCEGLQSELPKPKIRAKVVDLEFSVEVSISDAGRYGLQQIPQGQWWQGMWQFPMSELAFNPVDRGAEAATIQKPGRLVSLGTIKHQVTHHRIRLHVTLQQTVRESPELTWKTAEELVALPMPAPQRKALALVQTPTLFRPEEGLEPA